ncbi:ethionine resistance protein [Coemansia sp. RSA 2523]|nr:ethionine resistance protein [Coemansia sp. RSA 1591]KAJ1764940.1 ethionine resistance protein [Coemansia sp. RSA 1752]KAJ1808066.1 ethionine resistance protein [Coemansia sp. RSA 2523]KAJ2184066.1 ethionine resistance protein [Coemansia sp. RSA 532]KAJ2195152.1 ethionine resistance protein [Coemansia sp. RSA 522]KAJ2256584.1 ethionine resistance protein [Coemansia sp. RSA 454]
MPRTTAEYSAQPLMDHSAAPEMDQASFEFSTNTALADGSDAGEADLEPDELLACGNVKAEVRKLVWSALPIILSTTTQLFVMIPMMAAVGGLGTIALASMNLVSIYAGLCGIAPLSGMAMVLDSMCSQAYTAAKDKRLLGLYLQRVLVLLLAIEVVLYPIWWNSQPVFEHVGIPTNIAKVAGQMLRLYFFGIGALFTYECLKSYLFAQGIRRVAVITQLFSLPIAWLSIWLFISNDATSMGILGVPGVIIVVGLCSNFAALVFIARVDGHQCWGGWSRAAFSGLWPLLKLGAAGSAITFFESVSLHMIDLGVLFLDAEAMAAQAVLSTLLTSTWYMGTGFAVAACNRVGNLLGSALPNRAVVSVYSTLGIALAVFAPMCVALIAGRERVASVFTKDPEVTAILSSHIPWPAVGGALQGVSMAFSGILRGQGRQSLIARIRMVTFVCISLPLSALAAMVFEWGLSGLWFGYIAGVVVSVSTQAYVVFVTDWDKQVELCQHRISGIALIADLGDSEDDESVLALP